MNKIEHLLVCLSEECAEIQKAVSKALRFGLDDGYPGSKTTNLEDIAKELTDLEGVVRLLDAEVYFPRLRDEIDIQDKQNKIKDFMTYAIKRGKLDKEAADG